MTAGCEPNWRDNPEELDRLCQLGAADLYGEWAVPRSVTTVTAPEEYL